MLGVRSSASRFRPTASSPRSTKIRTPGRSPPRCSAQRSAPGCGPPTEAAGLVDPTLVRALEHSGYCQLAGRCRPCLADRRPSPTRRRAGPPDRIRRARGERSWSMIEAGVITRPPGLMIDTGGTGKGLCADAGRTGSGVTLGSSSTAAGTSRSADSALSSSPMRSRRASHQRSIDRRVCLAKGGVATSGLNVRIWRTAMKASATICSIRAPAVRHGPGWSEPPRSATAPSRQRRSRRSRCCWDLTVRAPCSQEHGGVIVHDSGEVEAIGCVAGLIATPPVLALRAS